MSDPHLLSNPQFSAAILEIITSEISSDAFETRIQKALTAMTPDRVPPDVIYPPENLDAGFLGGQPAEFYLNRENHVGSQPQETIYPQGFSGIVAKDLDPVSGTYVSGVTLLVVHDVGEEAQLFLVRLNLPARIIASCYARITLEFHDGTLVDIDNDTAGAVEKTMQDLVTALMGADGAAANNGKSIRKVSFQVKNDVASQAGDFGNFGFRALAMPRGVGAAL
jgi:hypothetical protein